MLTDVRSELLGASFALLAKKRSCVAIAMFPLDAFCRFMGLDMRNRQSTFAIWKI